MRKPVPASAALIGLLTLLPLFILSHRNKPRLLTSTNSRWLPLVRSIGLRMKISIEYVTLPLALRGASWMSVMIAFRGSAGSTSP